MANREHAQQKEYLQEKMRQASDVEAQLWNYSISGLLPLAAHEVPRESGSTPHFCVYGLQSSGQQPSPLVTKGALTFKGMYAVSPRPPTLAKEVSSKNKGVRVRAVSLAVRVPNVKTSERPLKVFDTP